MQKYAITLLLAALCAGCAHHRAAPATVAVAPNAPEVRMVSDPSVTTPTLAAAIPRFSSATPVLLASMRRAYSLEQALPDVQRIAKRPLLAMTEYNGWLWYATDVSEGAGNQTPGTFLSGYAVQKGGYLAWRW